MYEPAFLSVDPKMLKSEERIIVAAIRVFAGCPIEKASLRTIAREAGISFSAITYHFKTKENLYNEVIRRVLEHVISSSPDLSEELPEKITADAAKNELHGIIDNIADRLYGNSNAAMMAQILLREHITPSAIYESIYENYFKKIVNRIAGLVRGVTGKNDEFNSKMQAFSIIGQLIAIRIEREMFVRELGFTGFSAEEIEKLKRVLKDNIFRQLKG